MYGTIIPVGGTWVPSVTARDSGGNIVIGSISIQITSSPNNFSLPKTCDTTGPDIYGYTYQFCYSYNSNFTVYFGDGTK